MTNRVNNKKNHKNHSITKPINNRTWIVVKGYWVTSHLNVRQYTNPGLVLKRKSHTSEIRGEAPKLYPQLSRLFTCMVSTATTGKKDSTSWLKTTILISYYIITFLGPPSHGSAYSIIFDRLSPLRFGNTSYRISFCLFLTTGIIYW